MSLLLCRFETSPLGLRMSEWRGRPEVVGALAYRRAFANVRSPAAPPRLLQIRLVSQKRSFASPTSTFERLRFCCREAHGAQLLPGLQLRCLQNGANQPKSRAWPV